MTWTPWALPGPIYGLFALSAGAFLLRTAPDRSLNRRLAAVLALEGIWGLGGLFFLVESQTVFMWMARVSVAALAAVPFQYVSFLGAALDMPVIRAFRSRTAGRALAASSLLAAVMLVFFPRVFIGELYSPSWATWNFRFTAWGAGLTLLQGGVSLLALVLSLAAFLRARRGSAARAQARWFALAFGLRDLVIASLFLSYPILRPIRFWGDFAYNELVAFTNLIYVGLLSYGVLRVQLFDIDLKLKLALRRSTVGAIIAGAFFLGSELLETFVPVEGTILGLVSAGVIVVLLRPVQRFAEGLANRLMRGVEDTPEYRERQRQQVYAAALEGALEDGAISERERAILARLAKQLELASEVTARLELDARGAAQGVGLAEGEPGHDVGRCRVESSQSARRP